MEDHASAIIALRVVPNISANTPAPTATSAHFEPRAVSGASAVVAVRLLAQEDAGDLLHPPASAPVRSWMLRTSRVRERRALMASTAAVAADMVVMYGTL